MSATLHMAQIDSVCENEVLSAENLSSIASSIHVGTSTSQELCESLMIWNSLNAIIFTDPPPTPTSHVASINEQNAFIMFICSY